MNNEVMGYGCLCSGIFFVEANMALGVLKNKDTI
jgi:hypothetical protein